MSREQTGAAKITIQKFYLPNGSSTQLKGVVPDIALPSIDDYLPIGESSLPHALIWDRTTTARFQRPSAGPQGARRRCARTAWGAKRPSRNSPFCGRMSTGSRPAQDQKLVSLNLTSGASRSSGRRLHEGDGGRARPPGQGGLSFKEFRVAPPPPPRIKAAKKASGDDDDDEDALSTDDDAPYPKWTCPCAKRSASWTTRSIWATTMSTGPATMRR